MRTPTPGRIEVASSEKRARFPLNTQFSIPAKGVAGIFGAPGCETTFRAPHLRAIGYVFKESSLFPHLSIRRNLLYATPKREPRPIAFDELAGLLGIVSLLDRSPAHLSAGEQQSVAIGRALLCQPRVLLMDELLATLDRCAKREILPCLKRLNGKLAVPTIYISHDMAEIEHLANHLVMMERGAITAAGPLHIFQSDPALPLRRGTKPPSALMPWSAAMGYSSSASKVRGPWCRRRRLHPACTSGSASRPTTSVSRAKRRAQAPSSMSFRRGLKLVFHSTRPKSLWCLRSAPAAQVRTFWRASRITRLIRYAQGRNGRICPAQARLACLSL